MGNRGRRERSVRRMEVEAGNRATRFQAAASAGAQQRRESVPCLRADAIRQLRRKHEDRDGDRGVRRSAGQVQMERQDLWLYVVARTGLLPATAVGVATRMPGARPSVSIGVVLTMLTMVVVAGCSSSTHSPPPAATAAPIASPKPMTQSGYSGEDLGGEHVSFTASDGVLLRGHLYGHGSTGVILAHMYP